MIKRLLLIFLFLIGAIFIGLQLGHDGGLVIIAFNGFSIETTLTVGAFVCIVFFIVLSLALKTLHALFSLPQNIGQWFKQYQHHKAQNLTQKGLIEFSEGYWKKAQKNLIASVSNTKMPLLNYLTAARTAQELGDSALRDNFLRQAQQSTPDAKIAVELTQAQLQIAQKQYEQALATLRHLQDLVPKHPYVLKCLTYLYEEIKDWSSLIQLLPILKAQHIFSEKITEEIEANAYRHYFENLNRADQIEEASRLFYHLPKKSKKNQLILAAYAKTQLNTHPLETEKLLRHHIHQSYSSALIDLYGQLYTGPKQITFAEKQLKEHGHDPILHLCLARLYLKQDLIGKAKFHFEKSLDIKPHANTYLEYGDLLNDILGEKNKALEMYHKGLLFKMNAPPPLTQ